MKTSIIVCTKDRLKDLIRFTVSLKNQSLQPDEYIIVDSTTPAINENEGYSEITRLYPRLKYHHTQPGLTFQRNYGISVSTGEVLFFFDDDIVLDPEYLQIIVQTFENHPEFSGGMGQIARKKYGCDYKLHYFYCRLFHLAHECGDGKFYASGFARLPHGTNEFKEVEVLSGGIAAYKNHVFKEFSFDTFFQGYGFMEDADFSKRVSTQHKLFYNPLAKCQHLHNSTSRAPKKNLKKMVLANHKYCFYKNFYPESKWRLIPYYYTRIGMHLNPSFDILVKILKRFKLISE